MAQGLLQSISAFPFPHPHGTIVWDCGSPVPCIAKHKAHSQRQPWESSRVTDIKGGPRSALPLCWLKPNPSESWKYDPGGDGLWFNVIQVQQATLLKEAVVNYLCLILLADGGHGIFSSTRAQLVANNCYISSEIYCRCLNFNNLNNKLNQVERGSGRLALLMKAGQLLRLSAFSLWHEWWHPEMKSGYSGSLLHPMTAS